MNTRQVTYQNLFTVTDATPKDAYIFLLIPRQNCIYVTIRPYYQ